MGWKLTLTIGKWYVLLMKCNLSSSCFMHWQEVEQAHNNEAGGELI